MSLNLQKLSLSKSIEVRNESFSDGEANKLAGFINGGKIAWVASNSILRVFSVDTGEEVANYNFGKHGFRECKICCVEEIEHLRGTCILAIAIEFTTESAGGAGMLSVFSVQGSKILGSMDMSERITCLRFMDRNIARKILSKFNGILAVGTEKGKVFFVDLMLPRSIKEIHRLANCDLDILPTYNARKEDGSEHIYAQHKRATHSREQGNKCFFTVQLKEPLDDSGKVLSILGMSNAFLMSVGLDDGRMVLFDLIELEAFHLAYPPGNKSPLTHMTYIEPVDDPRAVVYVWAFHASNEGAIAVLHSIVFDTLLNGMYKSFRSCSVRLTIPILVKDSFPISCLSISKPVKPENDDFLKICFLSWTSPHLRKSYIMVFDLNQWYKAQLPSWCDWRSQIKYAVVFEIPEEGFDISCDPNLLTAFDSIERPEEHFLPTSLSFNVAFLEASKFTFYEWCGIQKQALKKFTTIGPLMILSPSLYFNELLQASIRPQFYETTFFNMKSPIELKREFLLSVALEYNFVTFLKNCAWKWSDGSMLGAGADESTSGVSLSTLTEWIWKRVRAIKQSSNELSRPLFDYSSQRIDYGTQKQLTSCFRQLKILSDLLQTILTDYKSSIPYEIIQSLRKQSINIRMAAEYQEVLQWLLNVGLLPEGHCQNNKSEVREDFMIVPFPYKAISSHYETQRLKLSMNIADWERRYRLDKNHLYIDSFIQNECEDGSLEELWGCCYPPRSIQSLLRTLLVENISLENKCVIFIYLFMDISLNLHDTPYSHIVKNLIKFPTVFKINSAIIKRTQAFWNLDNNNLDVAVDEIISPLANDRYLSRWKRELLISVLLKLKNSHLALKALRCPGVPIQPALEVETLLANDLVSAALLVQRRSGNRQLLEELFDKVLNSKIYGQLLDLALTDEEGLVLRNYLEKTDLSNCINLHFVYLLQRSKFTDATNLMDRIDQSQSNLNLEPPKHVLRAYFSTMDSTTKKITEISGVNEGADYPSPLSNDLILSRNNIVTNSDIYRRCVQSINHSIFDAGILVDDIKSIPFVGSPKLGIFEYRQDVISRAQEVLYSDDVINDNGKRKLAIERGFLDVTNEEECQKVKRRRVKENVRDLQIGTYMPDNRIQSLTRFRNANPRMRSRTSQQPSKTDKLHRPSICIETNNFLATPVVKEKTPPHYNLSEKCRGTPQSILKASRSNPGSLSPGHLSEFDDNKSVKSITFAMPNTRESSFVDMSYLDESVCGVKNVEQDLSSASEIFFSPEKEVVQVKDENIKDLSPKENSLFEGPKARSSLSRSPLTPRKTSFEIKTNLNNTQEFNESSVSPFSHKDVLHSSDDADENDTTGCSQNKSIFNYVRKSILTENFAECSSSSGSNSNSEKAYSDEIPSDEHFEEEELPSDESNNYGAVNIEDSESSNYINNNEEASIQNENEVIEIPDSDEEVIETSNQITLESEVTELGENEAEIAEKNDQMVNTISIEVNVENSKESLVKEKIIVEEDREVQEILNAAFDSGDELPHNPSSAVEKSLIKSKETFIVRAKSVPLGKSSASCHSKTQTPRGNRANSEFRNNPKKPLSIEENLDSGMKGRMTRKKSQILQQSRESIRAQSEEVNTGTSTPRRMVTRALSKESIASEMRPETPRSHRGLKFTSEELQNQSDSSKKTSLSELLETSTSGRRLTRSQLSSLEKSQLEDRMLAKRDEQPQENDENDISDSDTIRSKSSSASSIALSESKGRKRKTSKRFGDQKDTLPEPKSPKTLTAIIEEELSEGAHSEKSHRPSKSTKKMKKN